MDNQEYWTVLWHKTKDTIYYVYHKKVNRYYKENMNEDILAVLNIGWYQAVKTYKKEKATAPFYCYATFIIDQQYRQFLRKMKPERIGKSVRYEFLQDIPEERADYGYVLQGYLFPDTYSIYINATPHEIIEKMLDNFVKRVTPEIIAKADEMGYTVDELITFASVLEKAGCTDVTIKLYDGARHELLNEINRTEVYNDILEYNNEIRYYRKWGRNNFWTGWFNPAPIDELELIELDKGA